MMSYREGQTATNPKTGQQVVFKGGQWVSAPPKAGAATGITLDRSAPGAAYLPGAPVKPDKSEDAYYREWRTKDPTAGNQAVGQARQTAATARRAEGVMANQETGGIYAVPGIGGIVGMFDPEIRDLDAIQSRVARQERQPGEGAISDFDAQQFLAMSYGKDKPTETNRALIRAQRVASDAPIQRRQFGEWYRQNFGTLSGFEEAWDRYSQDNPIFDPESEAEGEPRLNGARMNWRQYFGAGGDTRATQVEGDIRRTEGEKPSRPPIQSKIAPTGLTEQQRRAAGRFKGTKADSGTERNPSIPVSEEQYNALPPGTWYIHRSGQVVRKKQ